MLVCLLAFISLGFCAPSPPVWPRKYTVDALFSLPYGYGITEPIFAVYDDVNGKALMSYYNGMDTYLYRNDLNNTYMVIPRVDDLVCFSNPSDPSQPLPTVLPDLSDWTWMGDVGAVRTWQKNVTNLGFTSVHTMQVMAHDNRPLQLTMEGFDFLFGSHPDVYILKYVFFAPSVESREFEVPSLCSQARTSLRTGARAAALLNILTTTVQPREPKHQFDEFLNFHKKSYSDNEYETRYNTWKNNMKMIEQHNQKGQHTYTLKPNHFADWEHEEFKYFMLPKSLATGPRPTFEATLVHPEPTAEELAALPASIDWRTKGAVTMVKDQGVCGSCWTFGTTGSLEGAWAAKYGKLVSLSEQQIVDCAWTDDLGQGDSGCDGGFAAPAMQWIMDNQGIALQEDYKYLMVDGWCDPSVRTSGVHVKGYVNVTMNSEAALQQAVATIGPVAVAIDAAHEHFEYYSSGVYYNPKCKNDMDSLDHEVLVVGYGTDSVGGDYWIVKNSWSTHWGDDGYIKMARNKNNH